MKIKFNIVIDDNDEDYLYLTSGLQQTDSGLEQAARRSSEQAARRTLEQAEQRNRI